MSLNKVKKTIGWSDYSFNPITGCLNNNDICPIRDN